jgi:hypothetical protein
MNPHLHRRPLPECTWHCVAFLRMAGAGIAFLPALLSAQLTLDPGNTQPGSPQAAPSQPAPLPAQMPPLAGGDPAGELRDIVPPVDVPFWTGSKVALACAIGILLAAALWFLLRAWVNRPKPAPEPPDPRQIALRALFQLRSAADGEMESRDFAAAVAEILRQFLDAKYQVAAPKQTTEEFLQTAQTSGRFPEPEIARLRSFLTQCDVLKFAKGSANAAARHELLNIAESQVREASA